MQFARRVHSNTTLKGGEGSMEIEYLKKKKTELCTSVPTIFVQDCSAATFISEGTTLVDFGLLSFFHFLKKSCSELHFQIAFCDVQVLLV